MLQKTWSRNSRGGKITTSNKNDNLYNNNHCYNSDYTFIKKGDIMNNEKLVEFKIIGKTCYYEIEGVININTVDDDEPDIEYYDSQGFLHNHRIRLMEDSLEAHNTEIDVCGNSSEILQALWDLQDEENKKVEFEKFYLLINGGD